MTRDFVTESNGRDCKHGRLARKCEMCEMESELATLRTRLSAAESERDEANRQADKLSRQRNEEIMLKEDALRDLATERIKRLDAEESRKSLARVIRETLQARGLFTGDIEQTQSDVVMWVAKALDAERAAREEAEQLAVWAVRHGASEGYDGDSQPCVWFSISETHAYEHQRKMGLEQMNATDAGILAALRLAMKGKI